MKPPRYFARAGVELRSRPGGCPGGSLFFGHGSALLVGRVRAAITPQVTPCATMPIDELA
jgi:hypothetical protein